MSYKMNGSNSYSVLTIASKFILVIAHYYPSPFNKSREGREVRERVHM